MDNGATALLEVNWMTPAKVRELTVTGERGRQDGQNPSFSEPAGLAIVPNTHGYDVVDQARINEELGGEAGLDRLCNVLAEHGMSHILDDEWTKSRSVRWENITVPILSAANWGGQGLHARGNFEGFVRSATGEMYRFKHNDLTRRLNYSRQGGQADKYTAIITRQSTEVVGRGGEPHAALVRVPYVRLRQRPVAVEGNALETHG